MTERVTFQTKDQVLVVGSFVNAAGAAGCVLLLHMMPADRTSWAAFQQRLAERQRSSLAIDLRGHGESTIQDGRTINFRNFSDRDHQASIEDVRAALSWLRQQGFPASRVALAGASIGANLALQAAAEEPDIPAVALVSPGENFRGVLTYPAAQALRPSQAVWASGSQGDDQESYDAAQRIVELAPSQDRSFHALTSAGHGTNIFQSHPELASQLTDWLVQHLR